MPAKCCVVGCSVRAERDDVKLYKFPKIQKNKLQELSKRRQQAWLTAINRKDLKFKNLLYTHVCAKHFISGRSAKIQDELHPDWIPSLNLGYKIQGKPKPSLLRYKRSIKRQQAKSDLNHKHLKEDLKMVGKDIDPSEIGKHPNIIKAAQREMTQSDVLVCGKCHSVFHFIDLFIEHKENDENCSKESNLKDCRETKPKVWAFLLWKSAQLNNNNNKNQNDSSHMNSWQLYQTWVKMEESVRETWVVAGKTIQSFNRVGQGTLQEMPVKITKTVIDTAPANKNLSAANRLPPLANRMLKKEDGIIKRDDTTDEEFSPADRSRGLRNQLSNSNLASKNNAVVIKSNQTSRRAKRSIPNSTSTEFETVEKIVAKRFNPRRKMHEYLVKWEGYSNDQNTWEPQSHLDTCPQLLETFEKQLARQKEQRAAQERARLQQQSNNIGNAITSTPISNLKKPIENSIDKPLSSITASSNASPLSPQNRLVRAGLKLKTEDDKSLDSTQDTTGEISITNAKRKLDDSDFNANTTGEEDFEEDAIPVHAVKRLKNGTTITTSTAKGDNKVTPQIVKTVNGSIKSPSNLDNSAEIVIIKDSNSGIVRKVTPASTNNSPNQKGEASVRVLSRGESATSGIVRLSGSTPNLTNVGTNSVTNANRNPMQQRLTQKSGSVATLNQPGRIGTPQGPRPGLGGQRVQQQARQTPGQQRTQVVRSATPGAPARQLQSQAKTTTIFRPTLSPGATNATNTPQSGRMVINRNVRQTQVKQAITPEEKILQLSKSGDLKITRKTIPSQNTQQMKTPLGQNHMTQNRSGLLAQHQRSQMISSKPKLQTMPSKMSISAKSPSPSPPGGGLTLCPITGKILTESGEEVPPPAATPEKKDETHSAVLTAQMQYTNEQEAMAAEGTTITLSDGQQLLTNEDGTPLLVSGDDGTIYQVAGKNAEGQTILIAQGADGEQQFAYVAAEENDDGTNSGVLTLDNAVAEAVANMLPEQQAEALSNAAVSNETQYVIKQEDGTVVPATAAQVAESEAANAAAVAAASGGQLTLDTNQALTIQTSGGDSDSQDGNIPAEVVQADLPSPGGTRRVILLLQDGTFMMTEMHDDEYQALNIT